VLQVEAIYNVLWSITVFILYFQNILYCIKTQQIYLFFLQYQSSNWDIKHQLKCFRYCVCSKRDSCFQTCRLVLRLALDTFGRYRGDVTFYFCILIRILKGESIGGMTFGQYFSFLKAIHASVLYIGSVLDDRFQ